MVKRKINWSVYTISALLTLFLLMGGIYFGIMLSKEKIGELERDLASLKRSGEDVALEFALITSFEDKICDILFFELNKAVADADELGAKVQFYESKEKMKIKDFYKLKEDYTLTLIKYWFYLEKIKTNCDKKEFVTNLYFYSNKNCPDCIKQGVILDYAKKLYPENLMTFAIDFDINLNVVNLLKNIYKVEKTPTLIIDGEKYEGLVTLDELKSIICSKINVCKN
jgi:hypothetical protein